MVSSKARNGDEFVDQVLTSLRVISMIKEGQKVCVRNGVLSLEAHSTGVYTAIRRWMNNDNRYSTIAYIKNVINNAMDISRLHTCDQTLDKLNNALKTSLVGLNSLEVTYEGDAAIMATIQVMQERVQSEITNINLHVRGSVKPKDK